MTQGRAHAEVAEKDPAHQADDALMGDDRRRDRRQTECRDGAVEGVGGRRSQSGDEPDQAAIGQRAPDAEQTDRPHRGRDGEADGQTAREEREVHPGVPFHERAPGFIDTQEHKKPTRTLPVDHCRHLR